MDGNVDLNTFERAVGPNDSRLVLWPLSNFKEHNQKVPQE